MSFEPAYNPAKYESDIYQLWESAGAFMPSASDKEPFSIIMPPPNANGSLHAGHGMYVVEDILTRFKRMQGFPTLWLPGVDHAGIETQVVYERDVLAKQGKTRFDLGKDEFYRQALAFTHENSPKMIDQMRRLGLSADWSRLKFTLDDDIVEIVYATFKQLHEDKLIYRGNRIVNWCPNCQSVFADVEIKHEERQDQLYTLDYGPIKIATTRPETIFADSAVAVNPKDKRYAKLVGRTAVVPLVDRPIPIIADNYVDPAYGTGALKVTPGHDFNDYEIGQRHNLPEITVIDFDGRMISVPEELAGLTVGEARTKTVAMLQAAGKLLDAAPLTHSVALHDRCGSVIEPLITEQWFFRMKELKLKAIEAVKTGRTDIIPRRFVKVYVDWLENLHDWNISRQNWFGIRIPVYYKTSNDPDKEPYIVTADEAEAKAYYGAGNYRAETDNFDTWFSSSQWPFATLQATGDFARFYPTTFMGTARDILTKWVVTMMILGLYRTGQSPFRHVYLWGMVNDAHGKKMSKSKGNVIDPLVITGKYGTDALRLALTIGITPGNDGSLSEAKIEGYRNFVNKLWNVSRYIAQTVGDQDFGSVKPQTPYDHWMMARLSRATQVVTKALEEYRFSDAGQEIYALVWNDLADWYIEASKVGENRELLALSLETVLKLAHPLAPFVTEAIWQRMPWTNGNLITTEWPELAKPDAATQRQAREFDRLKALIEDARSKIAATGASKPGLVTTDASLADQAPLITRLAGLNEVKLAEQGSGLRLQSLDYDAWLDLPPDVIGCYRKQLENSLVELKGYLSRLDKQLSNKTYVSKAPRAVVADSERRRDEAKLLVSKLHEQITALEPHHS